jgi:hypothetical protein
MQNNLLYPQFSKQPKKPKIEKKRKKEDSVVTLWGVLGTFLGGLGGVEDSLEIPLSCPKIEGENGELGPEWSVLNLNIFLLGLLNPPWPPAGEEKEPKSDPKSSDFNNLA